MGRQNPYLSAARATKSTIMRYLFTILGGLSTAFFTIGLILCFTDRSLRDSWWVAVILLIPSVWMLWKGVSSGRDLTLARRYQGIFLADEHGSVSLEELMKQTGSSGAAIAKELSRLFRKGYFQGCRLRHDPLSVTLTGTKKSGELYVSVICPHCGGTTRLRAGSRGKCDFCDSAISAQ